MFRAQERSHSRESKRRYQKWHSSNAAVFIINRKIKAHQDAALFTPIRAGCKACKVCSIFAFILQYVVITPTFKYSLEQAARCSNRLRHIYLLNMLSSLNK